MRKRKIIRSRSGVAGEVKTEKKAKKVRRKTKKEAKNVSTKKQDPAD
jgi:hypothetical protein